MDIQIKRIYDAPDATDGFRILVDRVWPRGVSREKAALKEWDKMIAPSSELRKWFGHDPSRYEEFRKRYWKELEDNPEMESFITLIRQHMDEGPVTLLFGAKDREHNQAVVLREFLEEKI
ncbi:DUF488 domain-containing protein [Allisonella histaminiformans]|uniref:DUF488 domain-containing protein n=1 Tax=Allisonella histaminiformans TaxID=209880 RepID=UPI0022E6F165|nr:DUF488 domain-containing protein [Allisonella histaminiformans]